MALEFKADEAAPRLSLSNVNVLPENGLRVDPAVDAPAVVADQETPALNRLNEVKILAAPDAAETVSAVYSAFFSGLGDVSVRPSRCAKFETEDYLR